MAISSYLNEDGETRYRLYVNIRSKVRPTLRAQRRLSDIKTLKEAEKGEIQLIRECEREIIDKEAGGSSWSAVVDAWEAHLKKGHVALATTTQHDYAAALRNHTGHWMGRPAAEITTLNIEELLDQMKAEGRSQEFRKKYKNMLNRVFWFGIKSGLIPGLTQSPTLGIKLERMTEKTPEILTFSQIRQLLFQAKVYNHPWYPVWAMALLTGMRNGELFALEWGDINWENKTILVSRSYNKRLRETKKTKAGYWRTVPISSELLALLKELKANSNGRKSVLPHFREWHMGMQAHELRKFCLGAGLPSIRFHTLRACFATQLIRAGIPAIQLQMICGWKDLKTMQRYIRIAGIEVQGVTEGVKFLPNEFGALSEGTAVASSVAPQLSMKALEEMKTMATCWLPSRTTA